MTATLAYPFFVSLGVLIFIIYISHKHAFFLDHASTEKPQNYHTDTTPRAGGIGIVSGMFFFIFTPLGIKLLLPVFFAFLSGIFEDFHNSLSPKFRLSLQVMTALSAILLTGSVVTYLGLGIYMPYWAGVLFSTFAIVGMMNAINIIDGFNGLASGIILLILISFGITAYQQENFDMFRIILITGGTTLGFFLLNFPRGKIFLGDGGAYLLGFIVSLIGIFLASKYEGVSPWYILAMFIYPVWEVVFSIIRKKYMGRSPLQPDSYHLHMLIYRQITHNNPKTALFILAAILPFMTLSTLFPNKSNSNIAIAVFFIFCYLFLYRYLYKRETEASRP